MAEAPSQSMGLPPLALYPPYEVRNKITPPQWQACLDSWLLSIEFRLKMTDKAFSGLDLDQESLEVKFLRSYLEQSSNIDAQVVSPLEDRLWKRCYLLCRRVFLRSQALYEGDQLPFTKLLLVANNTFQGVLDWAQTLKAVRSQNQKWFDSCITSWKIRSSGTLATNGVADDLSKMTALVKVFSEVGLILMTGSDYLESLVAAYARLTVANDQRSIVEHLFWCLRSMLTGRTKHASSAMDHLYYLDSEVSRSTKSGSNGATLLSALLCTTSFLRFFASDSDVVNAQRGTKLLEKLMNYQEQSRHFHPIRAAPKTTAKKGKARARNTEQVHIHQAAHISQIHELFPDLPDGYIKRLLDHFEANVENVIASLLEPESLPANLRNPSAEDEHHVSVEPHEDLAPRSTPPLLPQRKNIFDNDDFDNLRISSKQLQRGRKEGKIDEGPSSEEHTRSKAAIMAALAAFDADDDERDDSYDVADVGGTVDQTVDSDQRRRAEPSSEQDKHEESLFKAWKDHSAMFARDSKTRASPLRQNLKRETNMTDEQIEGWAIMLGRDATLQNRLQQKYSVLGAFRGNQPSLQRNKWQQDSSVENSMDEGEGSSNEPQGNQKPAGHTGSRGRGRGRGTGAVFHQNPQAVVDGGRGGRPRGSNRGGGRANHNRREGRARKMGRGMAGATVE